MKEKIKIKRKNVLRLLIVATKMFLWAGSKPKRPKPKYPLLHRSLVVSRTSSKLSVREKLIQNPNSTLSPPYLSPSLSDLPDGDACRYRHQNRVRVSVLETDSSSFWPRISFLLFWQHRERTPRQTGHHSVIFAFSSSTLKFTKYLQKFGIVFSTFDFHYLMILLFFKKKKKLGCVRFK